MRITLFIGSLTGGGAERVVCNLANHLSKNHSVTVLTVSDKQTYKLLENVQHIILYKETGTRLPHLVVNIIRYIKMVKYFAMEKPDVYITFLPMLTKMIMKHKWLIKCPVLLAERADPETFCKSSKKNNKLFEKYYHKADGYFFQTENAKQYYITRGINVNNSKVIANAINPYFIDSPDPDDNSKRIVAVGRLSEQKNFSMLLKAFAMVNERIPGSGYHLVIYGQGPLLEQLKNEAIQLNIEKSVEFPGYVKDMKSELLKSKMFVLSSDFEGMPNALMEAMAIGLPCVSTKCKGGGAEFLISNYDNGILVPINDAINMASAIEEVLSNKKLAQKLGNNAKKIQEYLAPEIIYDEWEKFIIQTKKV